MRYTINSILLFLLFSNYCLGQKLVKKSTDEFTGDSYLETSLIPLISPFSLFAVRSNKNQLVYISPTSEQYKIQEVYFKFDDGTSIHLTSVGKINDKEIEQISKSAAYIGFPTGFKLSTEQFNKLISKNTSKIRIVAYDMNDKISVSMNRTKNIDSSTLPFHLIQNTIKLIR